MYRWYSVLFSRFRAVVSSLLETTVVNLAIYCPASSSSTPLLSISCLMASLRASISAEASAARASFLFRDLDGGGWL